MSYCDNLRKLRGNETQEKIAKKCKISKSAYAMYEQGKRVPRDEIKVRLAKCFETTVQSIFFT